MEKSLDISDLDALIQRVYNTAFDLEEYDVKYVNITDLQLERFVTNDYDLGLVFRDVTYVGDYPTGLEYNGQEIRQHWLKRSYKISKTEVLDTHIRIIPYQSASDMVDMQNPIMVNCIMKTLLSELRLARKTSSILFPIININAEGKRLADFPVVSKFVDQNKFYSLQITEKFFSLTTLSDFLSSQALTAEVLTYIFQQIIEVLYQITANFSGFQHGSLTPPFIDCYLQQKRNLIVPEIKLGDFFLAHYGNDIQNNYVKKISRMNINHSYDDLYQFVAYMWNRHRVELEKYPEIMKIMDIILPVKLRMDIMPDTLNDALWGNLTENEKNMLKIQNIYDHNIFRKLRNAEKPDVNQELLQDFESNSNPKTRNSKLSSDTKSKTKTKPKKSQDVVISEITEIKTKPKEIEKIDDEDDVIFSEIPDSDIPVVKAASLQEVFIRQNRDVDETESDKKYIGNNIDSMDKPNKKTKKSNSDDTSNQSRISRIVPKYTGTRRIQLRGDVSPFLSSDATSQTHSEIRDYNRIASEYNQSLNSGDNRPSELPISNMDLDTTSQSRVKTNAFGNLFGVQDDNSRQALLKPDGSRFANTNSNANSANGYPPETMSKNLSATGIDPALAARYFANAGDMASMPPTYNAAAMPSAAGIGAMPNMQQLQQLQQLQQMQQLQQLQQMQQMQQAQNGQMMPMHQPLVPNTAADNFATMGQMGGGGAGGDNNSGRDKYFFF